MTTYSDLVPVLNFIAQSESPEVTMKSEALRCSWPYTASTAPMICPIKRKKLTAVRMSGQNEIRTGSRKKIVFSRLMIKYNRIIFRSN